MRQEQKRIKEGRKYAIGDGTFVDYEKAYFYWKGVQDLLEGEDLALFFAIQEIVEYHHAATCEEEDSSERMHMVAAQGKKALATEEETRRLFEELMAKAKNENDYTAVFRALQKCEGTVKKEKLPKEENQTFGNNVKFTLLQFHWSSSDLQRKLTRLLEKEQCNLSYTLPAISQILGGKSGMQEMGKVMLVKLLNEENNKKSKNGRILKKELAPSDLHLPILQYLEVFVAPTYTDEIAFLAGIPGLGKK